MILSRQKISEFKARLFRINPTESLSKMSLIVIIALDLFVLSMIFEGLNDHTALLTSNGEYFSSTCRSAITERDWDNKTQRINRLQPLILVGDNQYRYGTRDIFDEQYISKAHPACYQLMQSIGELKKDPELVNLFRNRKNTQDDELSLTRQFNESKAVYDTNLLKKIATDRQPETTASIALRLETLTEEIDRARRTIEGYEAQIANHPQILLFDSNLSELKLTKDVILSDVRRFDFWLPIKTLAWQFLFLLPMFALFYGWNALSLKRDRHLQVLISSHLLVVVSIPIILKMVTLIVDIIPQRLLETLFEVLVALNIIALWHYGVILIAIFSALFLIYLIQKKLFSKEKLAIKRLQKGACYDCGFKLPGHVDACPFCGVKQKRACLHCHELTYVAAPYCVCCGRQQVPSNEKLSR